MCHKSFVCFLNRRSPALGLDCDTLYLIVGGEDLLTDSFALDTPARIDD